MEYGAPVWLIIALAALAANFPFVSERRFWVFGSASTSKSFVWVAGEWLLGYAVVGGVAFLLESQMSRAKPQGWEFYAVTIALYAALAFPGFVYRYLWRRTQHG